MLQAANVIPLRPDRPDDAKLARPDPSAAAMLEGGRAVLLERIAVVWRRAFDALSIVDDRRRLTRLCGFRHNASCARFLPF